MRTVLDIPDDLANELQRQAQRSGRETGEQVLHLMRLALLVEQLPLAEMGRFAGALRALLEVRNRAVHSGERLQMQTDPVTGLPAIVSPPDAPIHSMSLKDVLALEQAVLEEQDLQRAGISL
jgi:hypothetical protein